MKNFIDLLTPEQKTALGNCYIVYDNELIQVISNEEVTTDNFNVVIETPNGMMIATVKDISFYRPNSRNFDFRVADTHFMRAYTPDDVIAMLDEYLGKNTDNE